MATADDEQEWIRRAREGDQHAYHMLVQRYQHPISRLVARLLGPDYASVEDVTQDVFVRAYFTLPTFRGDASFHTWLTRIAVNRCRDERRRTLSRRALAEAFARQAVGAPGYVVDTMDAQDEATSDTQEEVGRLIHTAVASLPEKLRVVATLKDLEGHSYGEVSRILQCKVGTVKSRHARAREKLRRILAPYVPGLQK